MPWWGYLLIVLGVLALYVVKVYNGLVSLRNKVDDQASQIDVQLKKRFDLIPNLIEVCKGYSKHEKETLEKVTELRAAFNDHLTEKTRDA